MKSLVKIKNRNKAKDSYTVPVLPPARGLLLTLQMIQPETETHPHPTAREHCIQEHSFSHLLSFMTACCIFYMGRLIR